jgi:hypothetical protein
LDTSGNIERGGIDREFGKTKVALAFFKAARDAARLERQKNPRDPVWLPLLHQSLAWIVRIIARHQRQPASTEARTAFEEMHQLAAETDDPAVLVESWYETAAYHLAMYEFCPGSNDETDHLDEADIAVQRCVKEFEKLVGAEPAALWTKLNVLWVRIELLRKLKASDSTRRDLENRFLALALAHEAVYYPDIWEQWRRDDHYLSSAQGDESPFVLPRISAFGGLLRIALNADAIDHRLLRSKRNMTLSGHTVKL